MLSKAPADRYDSRRDPYRELCQIRDHAWEGPSGAHRMAPDVGASGRVVSEINSPDSQGPHGFPYESNHRTFFAAGYAKTRISLASGIS